MDSAPRSPNGFLSSLVADDYELIRPHLRTVDLAQEFVLVEVGETLRRAYLPHRGVISLVVKLARGEHVQVAAGVASAPEASDGNDVGAGSALAQVCDERLCSVIRVGQ